MKKVCIQTHRGQGDCEDCGPYDHANATVLIDGVECLQVHYDGHLGGGNWARRGQSLTHWALDQLGYSVWQGEEETAPPVFYVNQLDDGAREPEAQALHQASRTPVKLHVTYRSGEGEQPLDPEDAEVLSVTVPAVGTLAQPRTFAMQFEADGYTPTPQSWSGDWEEVYECLLGAVCELTIEQTSDD